ncbi:hypothetical protein KKF91_19105 [Myxococcota bacterium]|nr:hypothetical protein [Myxococcota bacterium]MBU1432654.1 hypothetical protein [Myxococcota bacterium]MBU1897717.1 hypothetical protein [Myxococcota bacterium]
MMTHRHALALLPTLFLFACADSARPRERQVIVEIDPAYAVAPTYDDAGNIIVPDGGVDPWGSESPGSLTRILVIAGDDEPTIHIGGEIDLSVILLDGYGEPSGGESIKFEIVDADQGEGSLSARRAATNNNGMATVSFHAGEIIRDYTVEAWHDDARKIRFTIHVVDMPAGGIDIGFEYDGPVGLGRMEVYLIKDPNFCEDPYYLTAPSDVEFSGAIENLFDRVEINPLLAGQRYSVLVRGRVRTNGVLAAGGCTGNVLVTEDEINRVTVQVFLLPLNPAGTYDMINHFNFEGAIPGTLGEVIDGLIRFFGSSTQERDIAGLIFDLIEALVREAAGSIGGLIIDLVRGWIEDDLNDIINDWIDADAPDWVRDFFTIGRDLMQVVTELEVISKVRMSKPQRDGTFNGNQNWIGLAFYWTMPCNGQRLEECRYEFTLDELHAAAEGIQLVFGQFSARIHSYNQGVIDSHTMDLQYGRLILFVLNEIILPWIADGARNIRDALLYMANCPSMARGITGSDGELDFAGISIADADDIEGWCTSAMGLVGDVAAAIIGRLRIDTRLTLRGEMIFIEETDDLVVDRVEQGHWDGVIRTQEGDSGPPFVGDFHGDYQRVEAPPVEPVPEDGAAGAEGS